MEKLREYVKQWNERVKSHPNQALVYGIVGAAALAAVLLTVGTMVLAISALIEAASGSMTAVMEAAEAVGYVVFDNTRSGSVVGWILGGLVLVVVAGFGLGHMRGASSLALVLLVVVGLLWGSAAVTGDRVRVGYDWTCTPTEEGGKACRFAPSVEIWDDRWVTPRDLVDAANKGVTP